MAEKQQSIRRTKKICNRCGAENPLNARACNHCGSERFAPGWVLAKHKVNRQVSVELTMSNPQYGEPSKRVTLSKWWPGNNATFHIPNAAQWDRIETIINEDLGPLLGWKKKSAVVAEIKKAKAGERADLKGIIEGHPEIIKKIVSSVDAKKLGAQEFDNIMQTFGAIADAFSNANAGFREAFFVRPFWLLLKSYQGKRSALWRI